MKIQLFNTLEIYKNIFHIDENNREINVYKADNCTITGHNLYYPNILLKTENNLHLPLLERTMSLKTGTIYEKDDMIFRYNQKIITNKSYEEPVFFFIYNTDNYFHFIYDSLPYLISYLQVKQEIPNLKLLMQYPNEQKKEMYPFVVEFLEILDIKKTDIVLIDECTQYNEIYISTSYTHDFDSNLPPRKEIYNFYQEIVKIVNEKYANPHLSTPKKIYVSRRTWLHNDFSNIGTNYTTRRRLTNEDELVEKLKTEGYEEIFTEKLTTIEKILYFSNATHVFGAIGGGISNVLFSPKTTKLEAIVSPTFLDVNKRFKYSLDCVDVYYNFNTEHIEKTEFKTYMRVKTRVGNILGEIEKIYDNKLLVSYTDGSNTGWNAQNAYKQIELNMEDVEKLDNGLNSPWKIII
jgi:capsular polysaccharide biosynthesis protein